jgi:isoleucyl-tRNA synthetase
MDITQIPKSMGVTTEKWMHYLSAMGVNFFNPYEEGWDVPGREGGKAASFNQFSSQDLTMSNVIADHVNLMSKIEDMIGELSGVSRQRQGQVSSSELVGNVERAVVQSSHITEVHFWIHNRIKKRVLEAILEAAKSAWSESGKQKLHYITDDMTRIFLDISEDFLYSDFGIFASDSTKEAHNLEAVRALLQPAMQNGASLSDVADIIASNNLTSIRKKLKEIEKNRQQREDQMAQSQNEATAQIEQLRAQIESEKLRITEEDSMRKAETAIQVAMINAGVQEEKSALEADKLAAEIEKSIAETELNSEKLAEDIRSNKANEQIKDRQVTVQASKPKTTSK